jgi:hypothetical protein
MLGSAIQFDQNFDFGGNIDFLRFLGFFEKKGVYWKEMKLGLFFTKCEGKGGF